MPADISNDVTRYFGSVPTERRPLLEKLHALIVELYPEVAVDMSYRMPTYKAKQGWVAIANQKSYVSLYTCGAHHLARFKEMFPGIKTGKGCINLRPNDRLPVRALRQVIRHAIEDRA